jgi:peptidoglycan hydrolase-like protein with peptidoglycan-binding domain
MKKKTITIITIASLAIIGGIYLVIRLKKRSQAKELVEKLTDTSQKSNSGTKSNVTASSSSTLKKGSKGDAVKTLQSQLSKLGYTIGTIDGVFGSGTESALKTFQKANNLTVDGVAGPNTLNAIKKLSEKPSIMERV